MANFHLRGFLKEASLKALRFKLNARRKLKNRSRKVLLCGIHTAIGIALPILIGLICLNCSSPKDQFHKRYMHAFEVSQCRLRLFKMKKILRIYNRLIR